MLVLLSETANNLANRHFAPSVPSQTLETCNHSRLLAAQRPQRSARVGRVLVPGLLSRLFQRRALRDGCLERLVELGVLGLLRGGVVVRRDWGNPKMRAVHLVVIPY